MKKCKQSNSNGDALQPNSNGLQPNSDGLQPRSNGVQRCRSGSSGVLPKRRTKNDVSRSEDSSEESEARDPMGMVGSDSTGRAFGDMLLGARSY